MLDQIIAAAPERWHDLLGLLLAPIIWIPRMQRSILEFFLDSSPWWIAAPKYVFLLFPVLLWVAALWSTQFSLYTLPFRSRRVNFLSTIMLTWWDGARVVWLYWVGVFRVMAVVVGWGFTLARLALKMILEAVHQIALMPFIMTGRMTSSYFQPGVPWIAFLMLEMTTGINRRDLPKNTQLDKDYEQVTCVMCHRGTNSPKGTMPVPPPQPVPPPAPANPAH